MRYVRDIFEQESYRGTGTRTTSSVTIAFVICSIISVLVAIIIIANWSKIIAQIAIFIVELLSSGLLVLIGLVAVIYFVMKLKWRWHSMFWR